MRDLNTILFLKINSLVGRNRWLDAFGRAGAEWVIVAMLGWYAASAAIVHAPNYRLAWWPIVILGTSSVLGWVINLVIGVVAKEPRPRLHHPAIRLMFQPISNWKSFPSDHAMWAAAIFLLALMYNLPGAWMLLPLALWMCWGRVYAGVHYPLDIIAGWAVASLSVISVLSLIA